MVDTMGIVKISDDLHESVRLASNALSRSINAQAEHWIKIGMLVELYPELNHAQLCQLLIEAESQGGMNITNLLSLKNNNINTTTFSQSGEH